MTGEGLIADPRAVQSTAGHERLKELMHRGTEFLGCDVAIMGGAMSWVSERNLVSAISNAGGFGVIANVLFFAGLIRSGAARVGAANTVTLARSALVGGITALVFSAVGQHTDAPLIVTLAGIALALDAVDGLVARRTGTATAVGARFDGEVDAFLILVLSVDVSRTSGAWVLMIGAARYLFVGARRILPWMRAPLPPRYWCKVVAAVQGVVLTVASAHVFPPSAETRTRSMRPVPE